MQAIDRFAIEEMEIPCIILMENSGLAIVSALRRKFPDLAEKKVLVVAGKGNNGGDGLVVARQLFNMGVEVKVLLLGKISQLKGSARINANIAKNLGLAILEISNDNLKSANHLLRHCHIVVDAIFGTGLTRTPAGQYKKVIDSINKSGKYIAAIDIPSGLDSDSGQVHGSHIRADLTISLALMKRSHFISPSAEAMGEVRLADISIPAKAVDKQNIRVALVEEDDIRSYFSQRPKDAHKGKFGHLLVIAGSKGKGGAAGLTAMSALRVGAGLVTLALPECCNAALEFNPLEVMTAPLPETKSGSLSLDALDALLRHSEGKTAVAIGPGISTHPQTVKLLAEYLRQVKCPLVIDADGLNCLSLHKGLLADLTCPVILTPHPKEFSRLTGLTTAEIQSRRIDVASQFAREHGVIVILKGAGTVIAIPDGEVCVNPTGNPGMATAGTGDVLTGMVGGLSAQGFDSRKAAIAGTYLHGLAGDIYAKANCQSALVASDLVAALADGLKRVLP